MIVEDSGQLGIDWQFEFTQKFFFDGYSRLFRYRRDGKGWYYLFLGSEEPRIWKPKLVANQDYSILQIFDRQKEVLRVQWDLSREMYVWYQLDGTAVKNSSSYPES